MNSAMLPSGTSPKASVETTFLMFGAKRCSLVASASPSVSLEAVNTNGSSFTTPDLSPAVARLVRLMSRTTAWPGASVRTICCGSSAE